MEGRPAGPSTDPKQRSSSSTLRSMGTPQATAVAGARGSPFTVHQGAVRYEIAGGRRKTRYAITSGPVTCEETRRNRSRTSSPRDVITSSAGGARRGEKREQEWSPRIAITSGRRENQDKTQGKSQRIGIRGGGSGMNPCGSAGGKGAKQGRQRTRKRDQRGGSRASGPAKKHTCMRNCTYTYTRMHAKHICMGGRRGAVGHCSRK